MLVDLTSGAIRSQGTCGEDETLKVCVWSDTRSGAFFVPDDRVCLGEALAMVLSSPVDSSKVGLSDCVLPSLCSPYKRRRKDGSIFWARNLLFLGVDQKSLNLRPEIVDARVVGRHETTVAFDL